MKKILFLTLLLSTSVQAKDISTHTAFLRMMDKITGRVQQIEVGMDELNQFGTLTVLVQKCLKKPPEEMPENAAFLTITDEDSPDKPVFHGWMFSSNPALSAMEHPLYDIWVVKCGEEEVSVPEISPEEKPFLMEENPSSASENSESEEPIED